MPKEVLKALNRYYAKRWQEANNREIEKWWPVSGEFSPKELEIAIGAILTQNTNWNNVEKAIGNLIKAKLLTVESIAKCDVRKLQGIVRPAGFYTQKAGRIQKLCKFILGFEGDFYSDVTREELLAMKGIGNETADSILLFACDRPEFVIDAYTIRILSRFGIFDNKMKYLGAKRFFENQIKRNAKDYKIFHALFVEHAKQFCKKKPLCEECPLGKGCKKLISL